MIIPGFSRYSFNEKTLAVKNIKSGHVMKMSRVKVYSLKSDANKQKGLLQSRIMGLCLLERKDTDDMVVHINGKAGDDRVDNIKWVNRHDYGTMQYQEYARRRRAQYVQKMLKRYLVSYIRRKYITI